MLCLCLWPVRRGRVPVPRGAWVAAHRTSQKESSHAPQNGYAPIRYMFSSPLESQRFPSCRNGDKAGDTVRYKRIETANARPAQTRTKSHSQTGRSLGALRADLVGSAEVGGGTRSLFFTGHVVTSQQFPATVCFKISLLYKPPVTRRIAFGE